MAKTRRRGTKPVEASDLRRQTFVEVPTRAMLFLRGIAANPEIREDLAELGYTAEEHAEGVRLLCGVLEVPAEDATWQAHQRAKRLHRELLDLSRTKLRATFLVLRRRHPEEARRIFPRGELEPDPLFAIVSFFAAVDKLGPKSPALATIEQLGFTRELRSRLSVPDFKMPTGPIKDGSADAGPLLALRDWIEAWAAVAHAGLDSRESLIRLGLVKRRVGKAEIPGNP